MRRILPLILAGGLLAGAAAPVAAQPVATQQDQRAIQTALVGVLAQVAINDVEVLTNSDVDIITVDIDDSLNYLLQNADIDVNVLNDSLNNIRIIRDVNIEIQDVTIVGDDLVITVNVLGDQLVLT